MEIKNECIIDEKLFIEAMRKVRQSFRIVCYFLVVIFIGVAIGQYVYCINTRGYGTSSSFVYAAAALVIFIISQFFHIRPAKKKFKEVCEVYKTDVWKKTTIFHPNRIEMNTKGARGTEIKYSAITVAYETEHLYILMCKKKIGVVIRKEDEFFTKGSFQEAKDYVNRMMALK